MVRMLIPYEPVEQARPRFTSRGKFVRVYDPPKVAKYKKLVRQYVAETMTVRGIEQYHDTALKVTFVFFRPIQKSVSKTERYRRLTNKHKPVQKPDTSNYIKSLEDSLNGVLWDDDSRITQIKALKRYGELPSTEITVEEDS